MRWLIGSLLGFSAAQASDSTVVAQFVKPPTASSPLYLDPVPLRMVQPHAVPGCLDSVAIDSAFAHVVDAARSGGAFQITDDAVALLRLKADTSDGICQLSLEFQRDEIRLEARRVIPKDDSAAKSPRLAQAMDEITDNWFKAKSARLDVTTKPTGLPVVVDGIVVGSAPVSLKHLKPKSTVVTIAMAGWDSILDTVVLEAGTAQRRDYVLHRTQAWLDSVRLAQIARRRDSVWAFAKSTPGQALPDLFTRLIPVNLPAGRQSVAILPFQVEGPKPTSGYDPGTMASEFGVAQYSRDPRFLVVEREGLNRLLREQALTLSGVVDDSGAAKAGRMLAARYLVTGTVRVVGAKQEFAARMVSVESGEIVSASVATCGSDNLENLYRTALGERGQLSASLYRSAAGPGWGQFYTNHPVHGGVALGATVAAIAYAGWSWSEYSSKDQELKRYRNNDPATVRPGETAEEWVVEAEAARKSRNDASARFGTSLALVGLVWVANLVDAGILGYQESQRIKTEYFSYVPALAVGPDNVRVSWRF
jgi:TolB-like protein